MPIKFDLKKYLNPIFVETGTFRGAGVEKALTTGFTKVISIEVKKEFYDNCCRKFSNEIKEGRVELIFGDSQYALAEVIRKLDRAATFWLDAHIHAGGKGEKECPLYEEIESISQHHLKSHSILIDDLRIIKKPNAWGGHNLTVEDLIEKIKLINPNYNIVFEDGVIENDVLAAFIPNQTSVKKQEKTISLSQSREKTLPLFKIIERLRLPQLKGIIHVGANWGQEISAYKASKAKTCVYIEPIPEIFAKLKKNIGDSPNHHPVQACVSSINDEEVIFNVASNGGQSSSILPLGKHQDLYPKIKYVDSFRVKTKTLDSIIDERFSTDNFDLLTMDVQGSELKVLMGSARLLEGQINYVYAEVSEEPLYEGGCTFDEITSFLRVYGFRLKDLVINHKGWGNAFYSKSILKKD